MTATRGQIENLVVRIQSDFLDNPTPALTLPAAEKRFGIDEVACAGVLGALLGAVCTVLVTAFGWGVWKAAGQSRALRLVGGLMLAYGSLGLLWPLASMHLRDVLATGGGTVSDTMHIVLGGVTVLLMFLAIGFGATAFGRRFRLYSLVSVVVLLAFGALTFLEAPRLQSNLATPWIGLWERINISVFLVWIVVLAIVLLRNGHQRRDAS